MRLRCWLETKDIRAITTGDGIVEARKGDVVVVAIVQRWEDADAAIEALQRMTQRPKSEEP